MCMYRDLLFIRDSMQRAMHPPMTTSLTTLETYPGENRSVGGSISCIFLGSSENAQEKILDINTELNIAWLSKTHFVSD